MQVKMLCINEGGEERGSKSGALENAFPWSRENEDHF